jgi:outer membrane protein assembly factor BamB
VNYVSTAMWMFRAIVSLDRHSGRVLWTLRGLKGPQPPTDGRNSPATPTPVTDGAIVCAYFGNPGLMCADADGRLVWSRTDIGYEGFYGAAFSLVLADNLLIVANDRPNGQAQVQALDVTTGATRWTTTFQTIPKVTGNNRTPIVRHLETDKVVILWGLSYLKALSLRSGQLVWDYPLPSDGDLVSSPIMDNERLYLADHAGTTALDHASLAAGRAAVRWKGGARANCASPVLAQGIIFTVTDGGVAAAQHAETGEVLWRHRLPGHYFASLVASPSAVYFTNSDGVTSVVAAESKFRLIATNDLHEEVIASMASADGELYIRTSEHLYAVAADATGAK